jgi:hypothetical protein
VSERRLLSCIEQWPYCSEGEYDPSCCRFPKSCSCTIYSDNTPDELLESRHDEVPIIRSAEKLRVFAVSRSTQDELVKLRAQVAAQAPIVEAATALVEHLAREGFAHDLPKAGRRAWIDIRDRLEENLKAAVRMETP